MSRRPTRTGARLIQGAVVLGALTTAVALIWQASYSAFSATTVNPTNNWTAGTVALTDNDAGQALFTAPNLKPNSTGTKCIDVTSSGSLASNVKLYGTLPATTNALSSSIYVTVTLGAPNSTCNGNGNGNGNSKSFVADPTNPNVYSGTLANFGTTATTYSTGLGTWAPVGTASESRPYNFVYTLDPNAPNTAQAGTASIGFTWEAQNT